MFQQHLNIVSVVLKHCFSSYETSLFKLLHISVLDGDKEVYNGMSEDTPQELLDKQIKIEGMEDKVLKVKII